MAIFLYNTLHDKKEEFKPIKDGFMSMYNCGPTVYSRAHIGNIRSYIFADLIRKVFEYNKYKVKQVINITDVGHLVTDADTGEDKIEKAAREKGQKATEISNYYTELFMKDLKSLHIDTSSILFPKATENIPEQIALIKKLEEKGYTYPTTSGIYFDTSKFKKYGALGNVKTDHVEKGSRIGVDHEKRNPSDFALWKLSTKIKTREDDKLINRIKALFNNFLHPEARREQEWDSPWGIGFPGWHLECSAMAEKFLGQPFDIHTGGIDHISIHHNNEIAQSEAANKKPLAHYWMHHGHILIDNQKISKSLGNTINLDELEEKGITPLAYKYWLLTSHYKTLVNFTEQAVDSAQVAFDRLVGRFKNTEPGRVDYDYLNKMVLAVNDDLDSPRVISLIWEMIRDQDISEENKLATILEIDKILNLNLKEEIKRANQDEFDSKVEIPEEIQQMAEEREKSREAGKFEEADYLRVKIEEGGFTVIDSKDGYQIKPKK